MFVTFTTEPAAELHPFIMLASIVTPPSAASTEPIPALNRGSSSIISTAIVTASRASIPLSSIEPTVAKTFCMHAILSGSRSVGPFHGPSPPAPPCMASLTNYSPQALVTEIICWGSAGLSPGNFLQPSIALTTFMPSTTSPKTA